MSSVKLNSCLWVQQVYFRSLRSYPRFSSGPRWSMTATFHKLPSFWPHVDEDSHAASLSHTNEEVPSFPQCSQVIRLWYVSPSDLLNHNLPWKYALSSEWTRSLEHWLGSGQHNLDKYKCWGILTLSPFPKCLHCDERRSAKASGTTLNLRWFSTVLCWEKELESILWLAVCPIKGPHQSHLDFPPYAVFLCFCTWRRCADLWELP